MLNKGIIWPLIFPWADPVVLVPKPATDWTSERQQAFKDSRNALQKAPVCSADTMRFSEHKHLWRLTPETRVIAMLCYTGTERNLSFALWHSFQGNPPLLKGVMILGSENYLYPAPPQRNWWRTHSSPESCTQAKVPRALPAGKHVMAYPSVALVTYIATDFITDLPKQYGHYGHHWPGSPCAFSPVQSALHFQDSGNSLNMYSGISEDIVSGREAQSQVQRSFMEKLGV